MSEAVLPDLEDTLLWDDGDPSLNDDINSDDEDLLLNAPIKLVVKESKINNNFMKKKYNTEELKTEKEREVINEIVTSDQTIESKTVDVDKLLINTNTASAISTLCLQNKDTEKDGEDSDPSKIDSSALDNESLNISLKDCISVPDITSNFDQKEHKLVTDELRKDTDSKIVSVNSNEIEIVSSLSSKTAIERSTEEAGADSSSIEINTTVISSTESNSAANKENSAQEGLCKDSTDASKKRPSENSLTEESSSKKRCNVSNAAAATADKEPSSVNDKINKNSESVVSFDSTKYCKDTDLPIGYVRRCSKCSKSFKSLSEFNTHVTSNHAMIISIDDFTVNTHAHYTNRLKKSKNQKSISLPKLSKPELASHKSVVDEYTNCALPFAQSKYYCKICENLYSSKTLILLHFKCSKHKSKRSDGNGTG